MNNPVINAIILIAFVSCIPACHVITAAHRAGAACWLAYIVWILEESAERLPRAAQVSAGRLEFAAQAWAERLKRAAQVLRNFHAQREKASSTIAAVPRMR